MDVMRLRWIMVLVMTNWFVFMICVRHVDRSPPLWYTSTIACPLPWPRPLLVERIHEHGCGGLLGEVPAREHGHHELAHGGVDVPRLAALELGHFDHMCALAVPWGTPVM